MKTIIFGNQEMEQKLQWRLLDQTILEKIQTSTALDEENQVFFIGNMAEIGTITEKIQSEEQIIVYTKLLPLVKKSTLENMRSYHLYHQNTCTALTSPTAISAAQQTQIGIYILNSDSILDLLSQNTSIHSLNDLFQMFDGFERVGYFEESNQNHIVPIHNASQLSQSIQILKQEINEAHLSNGVHFIDPSSTYIGASVHIGKDTIIYPGTVLEGTTVIGESCVIGPHSKITDSIVGNHVKAEFSVITESSIGNHTNVGPYAYLRPHSIVGEHCKIGDFVEIKNSVIGNKSKASHLTYVGDSDVGENVNFGCGTVTVNYDGKNKARTTIKDNAFIGCNTNLVAPVTVESGAYTAAGSTITENVPENTLAVARARQIIKENWKRKK